MNTAEIQSALDTLTLIVDTREQDTRLLRERLKHTGLPYVRRKLDFGDYSALVYDADGEEIDFSSSFAVERKMSLDELAQCYTRSRDRFVREFTRAKEADAKLYLLVEGASWEQAISGKYRTRVAANALVASMTTWLARYHCQLILCEAQSTPRLLREFCYREVKTRLEELADDNC